MLWQATIRAVPRTKKNSAQIVRAGFRPRLIPSAAFLAWNKDAQLQLAFLRPAAPLACAVNCRAMFYRDKNVGDAVNFYNALADALQEAGVIENDRQIIAWDGSRLMVDRINPRIEIVLEAPKW